VPLSSGLLFKSAVVDRAFKSELHILLRMVLEARDNARVKETVAGDASRVSKAKLRCGGQTL
jgi:hypothetical protein